MTQMTKYYNHLCSELHIDPEAKKIESVCTSMLVYPFVAKIADDENLVESALYFRRNFARDLPPSEKREFYMAMGNCSVLEAITVLVSKMSYLLLGNPLASSDQGALFFELMDNLGLGWINDDAFGRDPEGCNDYIEEVLSTFVGRFYDGDGQNGGLFPLDNPPCDMRRMGLYRQLDAYLVEKYDALE